MNGKRAYAAIRKPEDSEVEFIDLKTIHVLREESERLSKEAERTIPGWTSANPVVRIAPICIMEERQ